MKNPEQFPWNRRLPEHRPDEHLWGRILSEKSLDKQRNDLKAQLPIAQPKKDLWIGIEKGLKRKKVILLWSRIASAAAFFLVGIWAVTSTLTTPSETESYFLQTNISEDVVKTVPVTYSDPKIETEPKEVNHTQTLDANPIKKSEVQIEQVQDMLPFPDSIDPISISEMVIAHIERDVEIPEKIQDKAYESKKIIAVTWEQPSTRIKIDGFKVDLSEEEIQRLNELENRKKGKFKLDINSLSARSPEK